MEANNTPSMNLTGQEAIQYAEANDLKLNVYANEIDQDGREGVTVDDARRIASEDPSLIWIAIEAEAYRVGDDAGSGMEGGTVIGAANEQAALDWIERWVRANNDDEYRPSLWAVRLSDGEVFEREMR